jgi:NADH-quinone oxidoreductase subunit L
MVARMSPLFELSETALNFVLVMPLQPCLWGSWALYPKRHQTGGCLFDFVTQLGYMRQYLGRPPILLPSSLMTHAFSRPRLFWPLGQ